MESNNPHTLLYQGVVHPWLCDAMGHLTTRHYMAMFDDASLHLLSQATGWQPAHPNWQGRGWADVTHDIEYRSELQEGSLLELTGCIVELGNRSISTLYHLRPKFSENIAAVMKAKTVFFDLEARRATPITAAMRRRIEEFQGRRA